MKPCSEKARPALTRLGTDSADHETPASHIAACGLADDDDRRHRADLAGAACRAAAREPAGGEKGGAQAKGADGREKACRDTDADSCGAAQAGGDDQARASAAPLSL